MGSLEYARRLAEKVHTGQVDKLGVPYIEHVLEVANRVVHLGEVFEIVALLHDSVEDCDDPTLISLEIIAIEFGLEIYNAVEAITKKDDEDYMLYLQRVTKNTIARAVKLADLSHNMDRLILLSEVSRLRLSEKYQMAFEFLSDN